MLNRRRFFQSLGAAVLGTAIALKIPEILIPQTPILRISESDNYAFGFTGYYGDGKLIHGRILAELNLQIATPRMNNTIYIEDC